MEERSSLSCVECGSAFEFYQEERERFQVRGFDTPKRCPDCRRRRRKDARQAPPRPSPAAAAPAAPRSRPPMNTATCTNCGQPAEVPFVPDGVRPVYCLPCLKQRTR